MLGLLKKIIGIDLDENFKELIENGALIVDVRSNSEFNRGHIPCSCNFPLNTLVNDCQKVQKDCIIITCCATGMRSTAARQILKVKGYEQVYNGGAWMKLQDKIS